MANLFNIGIEQIKYNNMIVNMMKLNGYVIYNHRPLYKPYEYEYSTATEIDTLVTKQHTDLSKMFRYCSNLIYVNTENWDTNNVTTMYYMFRGCSTLPSVDISNFDTGNVTNMSGVFYGCKTLASLDLRSWDTDNVIDMSYMFNSCQSLPLLDLSSFITNKVTDMASMFYNCKSLTQLNLSYFITNSITNMANMFNGCSKLEYLDLSNFNASNASTQNMLADCTSLYSLALDNCNNATLDKIINSSGFPTNAINGKTRTIYCKESRIGNIKPPENWVFYFIDSTDDTNNPEATIYVVGEYSYRANVAKVATIVNSTHTDLSNMFHGCYNLRDVNSSEFRTGNVTDMSFMFDSCLKLTTLDVSNFVTNKVYDMQYMFHACHSLTEINLSNFNTSKVNNMQWMFADCDGLTELDCSDFNTSNVTDMDMMFGNCEYLKKLDIRNFDASKSSTMYMFEYCDSLYELRLDNCSKETIKRIITSIGFPTRTIEGVTRTIYCKRANTEGLTPPKNWVFSYID